jgi:hypothetical protein
MLVNGGFEAQEWVWYEWGHETNVRVPDGWTGFWYHGRKEDGTEKEWEWRRPEAYVISDETRYEGQKSWKCFKSYGTWEAAIYQTIPVLPGADVTFSGRSWAWASTKDDPRVSVGGSMYCKVGIDPTGGTDPQSPMIVWSEPIREMNAWVAHEITTTALRDNVTVFVWTWNEWATKHSDVYWDDCLFDIEVPDGGGPVDDARLLAIEGRLDAIENALHQISVVLSGD